MTWRQMLSAWRRHVIGNEPMALSMPSRFDAMDTRPVSIQPHDVDEVLRARILLESSRAQQAASLPR